MTDNNNINSVLFELQNNLEDLSSAKSHMEEFRASALKVVQGIESVKAKYDDTLEKIKLEYQEKLNDLTNELTAFSSSLKDETVQAIRNIETLKYGYQNKIGELKNELTAYALNLKNENEQALKNIETLKSGYESKIGELKDELTAYASNLKIENSQSIQAAIDKFNESIENGKGKLDAASAKIQSLATEKLESLNIILEQYKTVIAENNLLIDRINEIDFAAKLDAFTVKSEQIIEDITAANQTQKTQLNETKEQILQEASQAKNQIIEENGKQANALSDKITEAANGTEAKLNKALDKHFDFLNMRLDSQHKDLRIVKILLFIILAIGVAAFIFFSIQQHVDFSNLKNELENTEISTE